MQITTLNIADLKPADYNPRHQSAHVLEAVRQSLRAYGFLQPVVVNTHHCDRCGDRRMIIVGGHRRIDAARAEGHATVPAVTVDLHLEDEKRANLRLNAQEQFKQHDLAALIEELHALDADSAKALGFSAAEIVNYLFQARYQKNTTAGILQEKFLIPPFSVLDAKQGYWRRRKAQWHEVLGNLAETREGLLAKGDGNLLMQGLNEGTSQFDPVLAEVIYQWFTPEKGTILDPFAGEQTKAFVAAALGYNYHGIEIRPAQVEANKRALARANLTANFYTGDSQNLDTLIPKHVKADLIFTSPPYYDLEIYSENREDISAKQTYPQFMQGYETIIAKACAYLNDNRFAVFKIGDIRDERGFYRNFIGDTVAIFHRLGFHLYNELIYLQMLATAPHRAERNMRKRKVVKTHQNLYTFYRGDPDVLKNPRLLELHAKVLTFFRGNTNTILRDFKNPPPIQHDVMDTLHYADSEHQSQENQG